MKQKIENFKPSQYNLKYLLGELTLLNLNLKCSLADFCFLDDVDFNFETGQLPFKSDSDVFYFNSYPNFKGKNWNIYPNHYIYAVAKYPRHFVRINSSFEEYLKSHSSKSRYNLKRSLKILDKEFPDTQIKIYENGQGSLEEYFSHAVTIAKASYQHKLLDYGLPDSDLFKEKTADLLKDNSFIGTVLLINNKPIAFVYCSIYDGHICQYSYIGYDSQYRKYAPGTVLLYHTLEHIFSNYGNVKYFDFTQGQGDQKKFWANDYVECADLLVVKKNFSNLITFGSHLLLRNFSKLVVTILKKLGVAQKIKGHIRNIFSK